ncbi:MAG: ABC transporter substrate-binding protein, partial [Acetobacteraceae bacterium]
MRRVLLTAACAALALFPVLPRPAAAQGTLRIALREDADILDPTLASTYVGRIVFAGLCDKLFDINEKLQIVPQLATGYEWADSKTLVIHLRPNVLFQDGEKLDAEAVKATMERYLTMQGSFRKSEINSLDHVEVVDPLTVRMVLKQPSSPFLSQLTDRSGMILPPKAAAQEGKDFGLHPVCSGPFKFAERVAQDHITLDRFDGYWDAKDIHFDRVTYRVLVDSSVRLANLKAGAVDLAEYIVPTDVPAVKADPKLRMVISDGLGYLGITFNTDHGPRAKTPIGANNLVRQAFELSLDRKAIIQVVYDGLYTPAAQAVPPSSPFYNPSIQPPARDIAAAKALLQKAGVKTPVTVNMMVR